jgi:hypothetical protein
MTKAQALKLARAKWGAMAAIQFRRKGAMKQERERASEALREYRGAKPHEFLTADDAREWRRNEDRLISRAVSYRYSVGYIMMGGLALAVQGSGDSWEEACRKAGLIK